MTKTDAAPNTEPLNVHQRILAVMADIAYIQKGDAKVNGQYSFVGHDAVTAALHPLFVEHGMVVEPHVTKWHQDGNRTSVDLMVTFINVDDPEDRTSIASLGFGIDNQDKGPGKAVSYAYKYALLKMFALETGDDPERDLVDHKPEWTGPMGKTELSQEVRQFSTALGKCQTTESVKELKKVYKAVLNQMKADLPTWWEGDGGDIKGARQTIEDKIEELKAIGA
ncbi:MAG: ERF family protein [Rhodospirillaceae bacterium]|nr:ERF family protein [Rhodospirillaceae bacterium]